MDLTNYSDQIMLIGFGGTGIVILAGLSKVFRNNKIITVTIILSIAFATTGIFLRNDQTATGHGNFAETFWGPLIYIVTFAILRNRYRKKYNREPTYNRMSTYDPEDGRDQNTFDVVVHVLPLVLSIFIPIAVGQMFK